MPIIKPKCPTCSKLVETVQQFQIAGIETSLLKCGHLLTSNQIPKADSSSVESIDGKKLFPYQREGVQFFEQSGGRALLGDATGVGKTVQALATVALHEDYPFLAVVKQSLTIQWQHEAMRWIGEDCMTQIIKGSNDFWLPGCTGYFISYEGLARIYSNFHKEALNKQALEGRGPYHHIAHQEACKKLQGKMIALGIKALIMDECQQIFNTATKRAMACRAVSEITPHIYALSGTPIKNSAAEYFSVLNMIRPNLFYSKESFIHNHCRTAQSGYATEVTGLRDPVYFVNTLCKNFYLRREREDVLPDLPLIQRDFQFHELGAEVEAEYIKTFNSFQEEFADGAAERMANLEKQNAILAFMAKMRHLVGVSKIKPCLEYLLDFLTESDTEKITVFVHHKDVAETLFSHLTEMLFKLKLSPPLQIFSGISTDVKHATLQKFIKDVKSRVIVVSTLAGGEGTDGLQACSRFIMLERQWNPANEEQAEGRFPRPGQQAQSILGVYFVATGSIDEYLAELVEKKRASVHSALKGIKEVSWSESSLMQELMQTLASKGGRKWSL